MSKTNKEELIENQKYRLIVAACSTLIILVLVIFASIAWFSLNENNTTGINFSVGNVKFTLSRSANDLFYKDFSDLTNDYNEDDGEIDNNIFIPATDFVLKINGSELNTSGSNYVYDIEQDSSDKLNVTFIPTNSTDRVTYSSSAPGKVAVSKYGMLRSLGNVGDTASITVTAIDRTPTSPVDVIVKVINVTIIAAPISTDKDYGFLPAGTQILRNPFSIINYSTVSTKCRVRISFDYSSWDEAAAAENEYKKITVSDLITEANIANGTTFTYATPLVIGTDIDPPIDLTLATNWGKAPSDGKFTFTDIYGYNWNVTSISLKVDQKNALIADLNDGDLDTFSFNRIMIDSAYTYIYYGSSSATSNWDYGDSIGPSSISIIGTPSDDQILFNTIPIIDQLTVTSAYTAFSTRNVFNVGFTVQSRQAKAYQASSWFDVVSVLSDSNDPVVTP